MVFLDACFSGFCEDEFKLSNIFCKKYYRRIRGDIAGILIVRIKDKSLRMFLLRDNDIVTNSKLKLLPVKEVVDVGAL